MTAALEFVSVTKRYGRAVALADASFTVPAGSAFGLAGANGAGKTTLIRCMLDLASPTEGRIEIFGVPSGSPRARERLAFLPERFSAPYFQTGNAFLRMMAGMRGHRHDAAAARDMAERLDLDPGALGRPVRQLSKGMAQKLGLAACLLADTDLLVLDEPMSGLDPKARARVKDLLLDLRRRGRTLFFTSHALADVEELCESVAVLHAGRVRFVGSPEQLRTRGGARTLERAFLALIDETGRSPS